MDKFVATALLRSILRTSERAGICEKLAAPFDSIFFVFNLRVAFSFLWGVEHVFVHFFTA